MTVGGAVRFVKGWVSNELLNLTTTDRLHTNRVYTLWLVCPHTSVKISGLKMCWYILYQSQLYCLSWVWVRPLNWQQCMTNPHEPVRLKTRLPPKRSSIQKSWVGNVRKTNGLVTVCSCYSLSGYIGNGSLISTLCGRRWILPASHAVTPTTMTSVWRMVRSLIPMHAHMWSQQLIRNWTRTTTKARTESSCYNFLLWPVVFIGPACLQNVERLGDRYFTACQRSLRLEHSKSFIYVWNFFDYKAQRK